MIYTTDAFSQHANRMKILYEETLFDTELHLVTEIIYDNPYEDNFLNNYLFNPDNGLITNGEFLNLKYLLIIGDETIISPSNECINTATDDYFSSPFTIGEGQHCNDFPPSPKLKTGRILINDYTSFEFIENIENYILNPNHGNWNSKLLLFCDDQYKSGKTIAQEKSHIVNSDKIYNSLKENLNITCLYGSDFERQQSIDWFSQPEFTDKLIETINNGVGLINYIGHGTSEFLADEDILTIPDLERISISNNKLPIWVVGTCSFGNYLNDNCLAEQLLNKGDAAIAVISTTGGVTYNDNYLYLSSFFEENLKKYLQNEEGYENYRLGDIFHDAKNSIEQLSKRYTFNLFGDPAMPLKTSKLHDLLNLDENNLYVGLENYLELNEPGEYTLKILDEEKYKCYCEGCEENCLESCIDNVDCTNNNNCNNENLISYNIPGDILFFNQNNTNQNNNFSYVLPIDANINNKASIKVYSHELNQIETLDCINLNYIENLEDLSLEDSNGPVIEVFQNGSIILNNSTIYPPYEIEIILKDNSPINLSGFNYHNLRLWYNNNQSNSIILNNSFINNENFSGESYNYSGSVLTALESSIPINKINIEAWDILNNPNMISLNVNLYENQIIYNVYNFPNPFREKTFFTFGYSKSSPINIDIDIYSLNGQKIKGIHERNITSDGNNFIKIPINGWDGSSDNGSKIANGTYIYYLEISSNQDTIHEGIYKLTKME